MPNDCLQAALEYAGRGFSVIPIDPRIDPVKKKALKKPFIKWEPYQKRRATPEEIRSWWAKWPGAMVGIVTGEISGIFVIDCDTPEGYEAIQKLLPEALLFPIARTPRGGWHLWFIYPAGSGITVKAGIMPGVDFRGEGGYIVAPPSVNNDGKGYTWQEGLALGEVEPATVPDALLNILSFSLYKSNLNATPQKTTNDHKDHKENIFRDGVRDENLYHIAFCLANTKNSEDYAFQVLMALQQSWGEQDEKWAIDKVKSAFARSERKEGNIAAEVREWVEATNGYFETTNCHKELQRPQKEEMKAINMALARLCEGPDPILEKHGNKRGCYRRIDRTVEFMNFADADVENFIDLSLPLGVHNKTNIYPKGVIVIAGVSGMGKTLFALNAIADNMGRFPIYYFNSEMGPEALKKKLSHFPIPITEWNRNMKVIDNWDFSNIPDKIQPDAFNVIDYLEPEGEKAFNIHGVISAIIRRLNKGTALITIQKKPGSTMGTGGVYSIKAATLALALDWGKLEVVKNRFREADPMPLANKINFEVHQGYKFVKSGDWYK
jgi:hypothetical protein